MDNIAVINLAVGLLVAVFSWRLSALFGNAAHLRYWSLYWAAATFSSIAAFVITRSFDLANPQTRFLVRISIFLLLLPRAPLIAMAAASLYRPESPKLVRRAGWIALALSASWILVIMALPWFRHPTRPAAGGYFVSAVAAAAFAGGIRRLVKLTGWQAALGIALILIYAIHLFAFSFTLAGWNVYPSWDSPVATAASSALSCLVVLGVGLLALREADNARLNYGMMVERTPLGILFYTRGSSDELIFAGGNPAADAILGISLKDLVGKTIVEAFPALAETDIPEGYREVMRTGQSFRRDEVFYSDERITGAYDVVCFRLAPGSIAVMFSDIAERKRAEEALRSSEARYRLITDNSTDMISVHSASGVYQFASPSCASLLGYTPEELVGRNAYEFFHPDDAAAVRTSHNRILSSGASTSVAYRIRRKDGAWTWVETMSRLTAPSKGTESSIIAVTRDISERRRLEEQFHSAQRLESVGRLAGGIAHDFNNLLTVINGNAALIEADIRASQNSRDRARAIRQAGESATSLVRHLLAFARRQRLEPVPVNLNEVVVAAGPVLSQLAGKDIVFEHHLDAQAGKILADPTQLQQVLQNLTVNARDAIAGPGSITIRTSRVSVPASESENSSVPPGEYVRLSFADSGPGIPPEIQERLFEPFFTTKPAGKGSGLGLPAVFGIVKQSNGHISVRSEPGRGAEFILEFPALNGGEKTA